MTIASNKQWDDADLKVIALANRLRADKNLEKALYDAGVEPAKIDNVYGQLASYPLKLLIEKPAEVSARNAAFVREIERFSEAVSEFERRASCQVVSIKDSAIPYEQNHSADIDKRGFIRSIPDKTIQEYLSDLSERVGDGEYGDSRWQDGLVSTPKGGLPTNPRSMACWLSIAVLRMVQLAEGARFNNVAASCATILCQFSDSSADHIEPGVIAQMLRNLEVPRKETLHK